MTERARSHLPASPHNRFHCHTKEKGDVLICELAASSPVHGGWMATAVLWPLGLLVAWIRIEVKVRGGQAAPLFPEHGVAYLLAC